MTVGVRVMSMARIALNGRSEAVDDGGVVVVGVVFGR